MSDDPQEQPQQFDFTASEARDGVARFYVNVAHLVWTGMDITVQLYEIKQPNREIPSLKTAPNEIMHTASVTMAWASAKLFYKQLGEVLERYEKANGPINTDFKFI